VAAPPAFTGTVRTTVYYPDGAGRSGKTTFDVTFDAAAVYGRKFNDVDGDGERDPATEPGWKA